MESVPFKITHIDITENVPAAPARTPHGWYLVFWWNDLPVGDWYIQANEHISRTSFENGVMEKTEKTIAHYSTLYKKNGRVPSLSRGSTADVSVVICTRNRTADLEKCLQSLRAQWCSPAEIIVVDNAPADDSTRDLVLKMQGVRYVREERKGLDFARNTGVRNARSPIVAFTDDDVIPHPAWIYHLQSSFRDPKIKAMTGLVIAAELRTESQQIFEKYWSFNRGYADKYYNHQYYVQHLRQGPPVWEIGAGANMAFRREIFEQAGYFDTRLDVGAAGCNGDSEMWFRVLAKGGTIHYNPRAVTFHHHRKELSELRKQIHFYMRGFAAAALIQQQTDNRLNYSNHLFRTLPKVYLKRAIKGFPHYRSRYRTLFAEVSGLVSGIVYYHQHKQKSHV